MSKLRMFLLIISAGCIAEQAFAQQTVVDTGLVRGFLRDVVEDRADFKNVPVLNDSRTDDLDKGTRGTLEDYIKTATQAKIYRLYADTAERGKGKSADSITLSKKEMQLIYTYATKYVPVWTAADLPEHKLIEPQKVDSINTAVRKIQRSGRKILDSARDNYTAYKKYDQKIKAFAVRLGGYRILSYPVFIRNGTLAAQIETKVTFLPYSGYVDVKLYKLEKGRWHYFGQKTISYYN